MYDPSMVAQRIRDRAKSQNIMIKEMLASCGLSVNTLSSLNHGKSIAYDSIAKIADYLDCSVDYLLGRTEDVHGVTIPLTAKDERNIEKILQHTRSQLESQDGLMFDGDPASPEAIESILAAMEVGLRLAKENNKKYTPKKYRK